MSGHSDLGIFNNFGASSISIWYKQILHPLMFFGSSPAHPTGFRGAPRSEHLSNPRQTSSWSHFPRAHPLPATPCQCPRSRQATLELGGRSTFPPLRWPDCTLSRLRAEEYDRPVTLSVSPHAGADGFVQGELPPISPEC